MAETQTNLKDELKKLAEISNILEESIFSEGRMSVIVELDKPDYEKVVGFLSPRDRDSKSIVIDISGMEFTLVLNK
jgi:hypothetical protein